jgi:hypothetical protein
MSKTFYEHFEFSMNSVGLTAPQSLFDSQEKATATVTALIAAIKTVGATTTIAEIVGAGTVLEGLTVVAGVSASFYAGACVGALIYASMEWTKESLVAAKQEKPLYIQQQAYALGIRVPDQIAAMTHAHSITAMNKMLA